MIDTSIRPGCYGRYLGGNVQAERDCCTCKFQYACRYISSPPDTPVINAKLGHCEVPDNVNSPRHYTAGKVECIDALEAATQGLEGIEAVCTANAIKYLWRWKRKNGTEDLKKARWYINKLLGEL